MPTVEESVSIERSPEVVWAFLTQTDNIPAFESQITHIEQVTPGEVGMGTQWKGVTKVLGRRSFDWVSEIVEFEPPVRSRTQGGGKLAFEIELFALTVTRRQGQHFVYRIEAESGLGGIFGKLGDPLVERAQSRAVAGQPGEPGGLIEAGA